MLAAPPEESGHHILQVDVHLLDPLIAVDLEGREVLLADLDLDQPRVEPPFTQLLAELLAGSVVGIERGGVGLLDHIDHSIRIFRRCRLAILTILAILINCAAAIGRQEQIKDSLFDVLLGLLSDFGHLFRPDKVDRDLDQIADHRFDIAADIADLGELRGLDLQKR